MGGRVAAHLSASGDVGAVVALAPWWPRDDADLFPNTCRLLVMHGTADTWTDPHSSYRQTFVPAAAAWTPSGYRLRAPDIPSSGNGPAGIS